MHAQNLLKAVLKPRSLSASSSKKSSVNGGSGRERASSPDGRLPSASVAPRKSVSASSSPVKMTCMCSPTNHPGSFRCRFHREQQKRAAAVVALPTSPRAGSRDAGSKESTNIFNEVNRTLPGRPHHLSKSPQGRTSRLSRMSLGTDSEEEEAMTLFSDDFYSGNLRIASRDQIARPVAQYSRSTAPAVAGPLREIPTMFCQSTSKKALDTFDRNMTRMYL